MLLSLKIKNIALIDETKIEFSSGFNVLTGETGAGKSIIIDALNFVLGSKTDKGLIKSEEDFAFVEAVFEIDKTNADMVNLFEAFSIECDDIVRMQRKLTLAGKNECRINGELVSLAMLRKLTMKLVDIFGQHDHQLLLQVKNHLPMLDTICQNEITPLQESLKTKLQHLKSINDKVKELGGDDESRQNEIELLDFEINQIEEANLSEKEEDELQEKKQMLNNSEKIFNNIISCNRGLREKEVLNTLKTAISDLDAIKDYDKSLANHAQKILDIRYQLEDIFAELKDYESSIYYSEDELNQIEERLDFIKMLKRKFGRTIFDVLKYLETAKEKKFQLENCEEELEKLYKEKAVLLKAIYAKALLITNIRKQTANQFEQNMVQELQQLGIKNATFKVDFSDDYLLENIEGKITQAGADKVEFLFSANLGQPLKSLNKIISGGEMSRLMLAFKCIVQSSESFKTFIFDEIDTGIGGAIGSVLAKKLAMLSLSNQVICVTHLSQIAVFGDSQFKIIKYEDAHATKTEVQKLTDKERVLELTRMIGTMENPEYAKLHAHELIKESNIYKQSLLNRA